MSGPAESPAARALERLLAEFGPRLRAIVLARCPADRGIDPDEVEQEVRVRLWQALKGENVIAHPASYLYRTTMSVIVDLLRRRSARPDLDSGAAMAALELEPGDAGAEPSLRVGGQELARALAGVLAALPERRRLPVQLHLQGFGFAEVARLLEVSDATARNLIYRGMEEVRERLGAMGWP
jgi:RNA polymerase sigma-70 factor (ECF subfamily)